MGEWRFPNEVEGWLSEVEGAKLAELARGKRVLEIGCFEGRSTICMAQTAKSVDCIDPCDGRTTTDPRDHLEAFRANMRRWGTGARLYVGTTGDVAPDLDPGYDLIFVDGGHELETVQEDIRHARRLLAPGGLIAFHDYRPTPGYYDGRWDPGVTQAVCELLASGGKLVETCGTIAVVQLTPSPWQKPVVFLAMPRYGRRVSFGAARGYFYWPTLGGKATVVLADMMGSALTSNFNGAWCAALNARANGVTHFAMIHDDVSPCQGWLDVLLAEMFRLDADVVSAVIPIKNECGLTSTAHETADPWNPRRVTLREADDLPETFGSEDVGAPILLNTGLWVCDLRRPWVDTPEPPVFQIDNRILQDDKGEYRRQFWSEDWDFSRQLHRRGVKGLYATRKVRVDHEGEAEYPNAPAWGTWETDRIHLPRKEAEACATA